MSPSTDVHGVLSAIPASIPPIGAGIVGLVHAGSASAAPFLIEGHRCAIHGSGRGTETRVTFESGSAVDAVDASLGDAVNVLRAPGLLRRERAGRRGTATETLLVAPTLPIAVIQWTAPARSLPQRIRVALVPSGPGGEGSPAAGLAGISITGAPGVVLPGPDASCLVLAVVPSPVRVDIEEDGRSVVFVMPPPAGGGDGVVTLLAAGGTPTDVRAALAAAAHTPAHAVRAAMPPDEDGMTFETGVHEIDEGFAWARVRLRGLAARLEGVSPRGRLVTGLAALAAGDEESARTALATLSPGGPEHALVAARLAATLGDPSAALAAADAWTASSGATFGASAQADELPLLGLAANALADGLRYAAPDTVIADLRRLAATAREPRGEEGRTDGPRRRLPMAGRALETPDAGAGPRAEALWWSRLLDGTPDVEPPPAPGAAADLRRAAAAFVANPDVGWTLWREVLARGMADGPAGPATWDGIRGRTDAEPSVTPELLLAAAHGLLGIAPDAPVGRLVLAPRLPSHVRSFRVRGIPLGRARLAMSYERVGVTHRFTLTPEMAAVPPLIVFEPTVSGEVLATRVDGEAAELDVKSLARRAATGGALTLVPVQLPLDDVRTLEIDVRPGTP